MIQFSQAFNSQVICVYTGCCLDVDWLDDTTFATCGADKKINIMRVDCTLPIKAFMYVMPQSLLNH